MLKTLLNSNRMTKRLITISIDSCFVVLAFWSAMFLRLETLDVLFEPVYWLVALSILPASLLIFVKFGLYRAVLRYLSSKATWSIIAAVAVSTSFLVIAGFFYSAALPKSVPIIYFALSLMFIGGSRVLFRSIVSIITREVKQGVVIYGAGSAGRQLAIGLTNGAEYETVAFIDDDNAKQGSVIQGSQVIALSQLDDVLKNNNVKKILLAQPFPKVHE